MGEIKSTLELIMERTKNLTMSEEEKRAFREKELAGKVKALVQRTLDGLISRERFREEGLGLQKESGSEAPLLKRMLMDELTGRIELGGEHEPCLALLKTSLGEDLAPMEAVLHDAVEKADRLRNSHEDVLGERLEEKGISGSAVTVNLEADPEWKRAMQFLQEELKTELKKTGEALI